MMHNISEQYVASPKVFMSREKMSNQLEAKAKRELKRLIRSYDEAQYFFFFF